MICSILITVYTHNHTNWDMDTEIKIHPEIIFEAKRRNLSLSGFRLWFLAKNYDRGNGNIPVKSFRRYLKSIGINPKKASQWIDHAINQKLIIKTSGFFRLTSWETGAKIAGCASLKRGVYLPISNFVNKGWLSWVWAAFLIHFRNRPVCRNTLHDISGIPPRTQYEYERKASVEIVANFADFGSVEDDPLLAIDLSLSEGHYTKAGRIRRRLGNSYLPNGVRLAKKGRLKQVNAALRISEVSSQRPVYYLYCESDEEVKRKIRNNSRSGCAKNRPDFLFQHFVHLSEVSVWSAVRC